MSLKEKLQEDLKSSMRNKDTVKKSVVTLIRASIKQYEVDNRVELDDEGIMDIISRVYSNSCPLGPCCHPASLSSVVPFSSCPQSLPASESFPMSQLFA